MQIEYYDIRLLKEKAVYIQDGYRPVILLLVMPTKEASLLPGAVMCCRENPVHAFYFETLFHVVTADVSFVGMTSNGFTD